LTFLEFRKDKTVTQITQQIDSEYFAEEDVMALQTSLIKDNYIDTTPAEHDPLVDPVILAKALDRLIDTIIEDIIQNPDEMLFGTCDGSHRRDFERAIHYVMQMEKGK
jgi:hypothetical protein